MITVFTPTYNRADIIGTLFESLKKQTSFDFEWLVVDDGSTDGTENYFCSLSDEDTGFPIRYVRKENGGKHTAINMGLGLALGELFFIVDSDDRLTPEAIATIAHDWESAKDKNLCGIAYLRGNDCETVIGDLFPIDHEIANFVDMRYNRGIAGDKAEVWVTAIMKQYPFPVFEGEKFFGESWSFVQQSNGHDMLWVNKVIYLCEYLKGGLTQSGRSLRIRCPQSGREMSYIAMGDNFLAKVRMKNAILYIAYSFFAKKSIGEMLSRKYKGMIFAMLPLGWALYKYWKNKYA